LRKYRSPLWRLYSPAQAITSRLDAIPREPCAMRRSVIPDPVFSHHAATGKLLA
jgi:hypothetical protein